MPQRSCTHRRVRSPSPRAQWLRRSRKRTSLAPVVAAPPTVPPSAPIASVEPEPEPEPESALFSDAARDASRSPTAASPEPLPTTGAGTGPALGATHASRRPDSLPAPDESTGTSTGAALGRDTRRPIAPDAPAAPVPPSPPPPQATRDGASFTPAAAGRPGAPAKSSAARSRTAVGAVLGAVRSRGKGWRRRRVRGSGPRPGPVVTVRDRGVMSTDGRHDQPIPLSALKFRG